MKKKDLFVFPTWKTPRGKHLGINSNFQLFVEKITLFRSTKKVEGIQDFEKPSSTPVTVVKTEHQTDNFTRQTLLMY